MARLPTIRNEEDLLSSLEVWRQAINATLPNEREFVGYPANAWFVTIDSRTLRFRFDPAPNADAHDVEWGNDPDFKNKSSTRVYTDALDVDVPIADTFDCQGKLYFRVRGVKADKTSRWSPTAVFGPPVPGELRNLVAAHTIDNPSEENPIINVNIVLPRTATVGTRTVIDHEAQWTDHVDLEAPWSTLSGSLADDATVMNVETGQGSYFKPYGYYKLVDASGNEEIVSVDSVSTDAVTVTRAQMGTTALDFADGDEIRFYARVLREMFTATQQGTYAVTVTIPNPEKVRVRDFDAWAVNRCGERGELSESSASLEYPGVIDDLAAEPFFQKVVLRWSELPWTAYRYEIYHSTSGVIPINNADPTATSGVELLARPLADHLGEATFVHDISYESGVVHYYGVRAVDIFGQYNAGDTVGPLQPDEKPVPAAPDVENISATEGPYTQLSTVSIVRARRPNASIRSIVTCGFDPPSSDPDGAFKKCNVYLQPVGTKASVEDSSGITAGATTLQVNTDDAPRVMQWRYWQIDSEVVRFDSFAYGDSSGLFSHGNCEVTIARAQYGTTAASHSNGAAITPYVNPIKVAEGPEAPLDFIFDSIGDVTLYFVSVNTLDEENQVLASPNLTVDLDGQTSAPLEVQNLRGVKTNAGGKVFWSEGLEPDLKYYEIADLGSRTLEAQADATDAHVVARVEARPGSENKAIWEWKEVEYEGEIQAGSTSVVLGTRATPLAQLREDQFSPIGSPAVNETLRFSWCEDISKLTTNEYDITDNDEDTISLSVEPDETPASGESLVRFHVGSRTHKFYVRAVNDAGLASEWRPVEGSFLELSATAPDGTHDLGVPFMEVAISPLNYYKVAGYTNSAFWPATVPGRSGGFSVVLHAISLADADTTFETALASNIRGITQWQIEVTHADNDSSTYGTTIIDLNANHDAANYSHVSTYWRLENRFDFIPFRLQKISQIRARARNYYGYSDWRTLSVYIFALGAGPPYFTGDDLEARTAALGVASGNLYPNLAESTSFEHTLSGNVTVQAPEYISDGETPGSGASAGRTVRGGEYFTIVLEQPASGTPYTVSWASAYKGLDGKEADLRLGRYSAWTFQARSSSKILCVSFMTGDL